MRERERERKKWLFTQCGRKDLTSFWHKKNSIIYCQYYNPENQRKSLEVEQLNTSHLRLGLPKGLFPVGFPDLKYRKTIFNFFKSESWSQL